MISQPKYQPMSLEDAIDIVEMGRFDYCHPRGPDHDPSGKRIAEWQRARAIVDAAAKAYRAICCTYDAGCTTAHAIIQLNADNAIQHARAMERGYE